MDPRHRLKRRHPGEGLARPGLIQARLWTRDKELRAPRSVVGDDLVTREIKVRASGRSVDPAPNAPLLKRIVRYPYRLHPERGIRIVSFESPTFDRGRVESSAPAIREARTWRARATFGSLLRGPSRPTRREARPTVEAWLGGE